MGGTKVKDFTSMLLYGAAKTGIAVSLNDISVSMLIDVIAYENELVKSAKGNKKISSSKKQSLQDILKGTKL